MKITLDVSGISHIQAYHLTSAITEVVSVLGTEVALSGTSVVYTLASYNIESESALIHVVLDRAEITSILKAPDKNGDLVLSIKAKYV